MDNLQFCSQERREAVILVTCLGRMALAHPHLQSVVDMVAQLQRKEARASKSQSQGAGNALRNLFRQLRNVDAKRRNVDLVDAGWFIFDRGQ